MKISIIIPVYNASQYLERCLDSILESQISEVKNEIILINDGSTDNSLDICYKYQATYINIIVLDQQNQGPSAARNLGIKYAKGKYIVFVDSDDFVSKYYLEVLSKYITKTNADIIAFNHKKINNKQEVFKSNGLKPNSYYTKKEILQLLKTTAKTPFLLYVSMRIIKLDIIKKHDLKFDEKITIGEDTLFNLRCYYFANSMFNLSNSLYNYETNLNSITSKKYNSNYNKMMLLHFKNRLDFHLKNPILNTEEYIRDLAQCYIEKVLFLLINNLNNKPNSNLIEGLKNIRGTETFTFCFRHYKNSGVPTFRMKIMIYLFKTERFLLLSKIIQR